MSEKNRRLYCDAPKCRSSVRIFDVEMQTPKADGWGELADHSQMRRVLDLCPLHNLKVREDLLGHAEVE